MWNIYRQLVLCAALFAAGLVAPAARSQSVLFDNPTTTVFIVDFAAAYRSVPRQEELRDLIVELAKGNLVTIYSTTNNADYRFDAADLENPSAHESLGNWIARAAQRARARKTEFETMNERFSRTMADTIANPQIAGLPKTANVIVVASKVSIRAGMERPLLSESTIGDQCIIEAQINGDWVQTDLSEWSIRGIGYDLENSRPADGLLKSLAAMMDATPPNGTGAQRVFYGFGNTACPGEAPDPYAFAGLDVNDPCVWARARTAGQGFVCPQQAAQPAPPQPQPQPNPAPAPQQPGGGTTQPVQPGGGATTPPSQPVVIGQTPAPSPQAPVPSRPAPPPAPINTAPQIPQGPYTAAAADLSRVGNITITSLVTQPMAVMTSNPARADVARVDGPVRAELMLAGLSRGGRISTTEVNAARASQRTFSLRLSVRQPCRQGEKTSATVLWSAKGVRWETTITGFVNSCEARAVSQISLGEF